MVPETSTGGENATFQPTLWTVILRAKGPPSPDRRQALGQLVGAYWKPVYFFVRRKGNDVEAAKDLTQSFFTAFIEKDFLKNVSPEKGRFRSFVMASLTYFLSDERDRAGAKKRGGGLNFVQAEEELETADPAPEKAFLKQWAFEVMARAMRRMREECTPEEMDLLTGGSPRGLTPAQRKSRAFRLRSRLREHLREIVRPCVDQESDVESEIRELFSEAT